MIRKLITLLLITLTISLTNCKSDNYYKNYVIQQINTTDTLNIKRGWLVLPSNKFYYEDITVSGISDSSLTIICWVDRKDWTRKIVNDRVIIVNVPYSRYKKKDIKTDVELIKSINLKIEQILKQNKN